MSKKAVNMSEKEGPAFGTKCYNWILLFTKQKSFRPVQIESICKQQIIC